MLRLVRSSDPAIPRLCTEWDAGMASPTHTPHGRGYNTSLNYYGHGNYMWTEIEWGGSKGAGAGTVPTQGTIDLWDTDKVRYT